MGWRRDPQSARPCGRDDGTSLLPPEGLYSEGPGNRGCKLLPKSKEPQAPKRMSRRNAARVMSTPDAIQLRARNRHGLALLLSTATAHGYLLHWVHAGVRQVQSQPFQTPPHGFVRGGKQKRPLRICEAPLQYCRAPTPTNVHSQNICGSSAAISASHGATPRHATRALAHAAGATFAQAPSEICRASPMA